MKYVSRIADFDLKGSFFIPTSLIYYYRYHYCYYYYPFCYHFIIIIVSVIFIVTATITTKQKSWKIITKIIKLKNYDENINIYNNY